MKNISEQALHSLQQSILVSGLFSPPLDTCLSLDESNTDVIEFRYIILILFTVHIDLLWKNVDI